MKTSLPTACDGFCIKPNAPTSDAHRFLTEWFNSLPSNPQEWWNVDNKKSAQMKHILGSALEAQLLFIVAGIERVTWSREAEMENQKAYHAKKPQPHSQVIFYTRGVLREMWTALGRRKPSWSPELLEASFASIAENERFEKTADVARFYPVEMLVLAAKELRATGPLPAGIHDAIHQIHQFLSAPRLTQAADDRRFCQALEALLSSPKATPLDPAEAWAKDAEAQISELPAARRSAWSALMQHAADASGARPSKKWLAAAETLLSKVGDEDFAARVPGWFAAVTAPKPENAMEYFGKSPMRDANAEILKGLAWISGLTRSEGMAGAVGDLALKCFTKVPGYGPFSVKVGNACLQTLESLPGQEPIAHLSRLRLKAKTQSTQKAVQAALDNAARARNVTAEELEEISVPTYGLDERGALREEFGGCAVEVRLLPSGKIEQSWLNSDGKPVKSVPAEVKGQFAAELSELKRTVKDIEAIAAAQRLRLEQLLVSDRAIPFSAWRERYLDHPLVAPLARRLIWRFTRADRSETGILHQGKFVNARGDILDWIDPETSTSFWHPLTADVATIRAWREWLEAHEVVQPFKQAHRELYLITDAERATGQHSNRFAAHVIRQHQFAALARSRGWQYHLQGVFDSANTPTLRLPRWQLQAEFWVEPVNEHDISHAGMHLILTTDQVRFLDAQGNLIPLVEVPPLAFSEVMRDVDLFIGMASIGNDPNWTPGGPDRRYHDYWHGYSFGDLSPTAKTRRDVLERLLPKLKIASRCELQERFLVVKGSLRSYKIHLGSGNILMEPNDQYLCIVPDRSSGPPKSTDVFLPFEGDNTLSLILSKAFLLTEDSKIKDKTIVQQITG